MVRWTHLIDKNRTTKQQTLIVVPNNNGGLAGLSDGLGEEMWRAENDQRGDEEKREKSINIFSLARLIEWFAGEWEAMPRWRCGWIENYLLKLNTFFQLGLHRQIGRRTRSNRMDHLEFSTQTHNLVGLRKLKRRLLWKRCGKVEKKMEVSKWISTRFLMEIEKHQVGWCFLFFMIMENLVKNASTRKSPWPKSQLRVVSSWISISYQKIPSNRNRNL